MRSQIFQFTCSFSFTCALVISSAHLVKAQTPQIDPAIKRYVEEKGKKAKVPAEIANFARGDLNNDGKEDVVIQYYIQIGYPGNLTNTYLAAFLNKNGKMAFVAETDAKVVPARIENGILICDKYGEDSKKFEKVGIVKFKLVKRKLVAIKI